MHASGKEVECSLSLACSSSYPPVYLPDKGIEMRPHISKALIGSPVSALRFEPPSRGDLMVGVKLCGGGKNVDVHLRL
jgi:hypothetical protein